MTYDEAREELILKGVSQKTIRFLETMAIHAGYRGHLTPREMFERSFDRPSNFFELPPGDQWDIDKRLGILDWVFDDPTPEETARFRAHYDRWNAKKPPTL